MIGFTTQGIPIFSTASCTVTRAIIYSDLSKITLLKGRYNTQFRPILLVAVELTLHFVFVDNILLSVPIAKYFANLLMLSQNHHSQ